MIWKFGDETIGLSENQLILKLSHLQIVTFPNQLIVLQK